MTSKIVPLLTIEANLKRSIRRTLRASGFRTVNGQLVGDGVTKERIRALHSIQRKAKLLASSRILAKWPDFQKYFASGSDINPELISPRLELIDGRTWQSDLFALATLNWSVPTSNGYGRRLRFLCWDDSNDKLIGLIALADPVFNLRVRDDFVGWTGADRIKRLSCVMDAYVLGAVPPYNLLLGGKLLACLLKSSDIFNAFKKKYSSYKSVISQRRLKPTLALITTSSSLGRSSVYNRLKLQDEFFLRPVGETRGYGHFHIPERLFMQMRAFLAKRRHQYASGHAFGEGANWRMRVIRETLKQLGLSQNLLKHGIAREVFVSELAPDSVAFLCGESKTLDASRLRSVSEIGKLAIDRWVIPRAQRRQDFASWTLENTFDAFTNLVAPTKQLSTRPSEELQNRRQR